jgi:hypothetical protein
MCSSRLLDDVHQAPHPLFAAGHSVVMMCGQSGDGALRRRAPACAGAVLRDTVGKRADAVMTVSED